jgi:hypothetical protein
LQRVSRLHLLLALALPTLFQACDEQESTLGGLPGGQAIAWSDTLAALATAGFHRPQQMVAAARQTVGRSDSLGLESVLVLRLDYNPVGSWADPPEALPDIRFTFKMDHSKSLAWFPQSHDPDFVDDGSGESDNYLYLELSLLRDSLGYDSLDWEDAFDGAAPRLSILDQVTFRVSSADTVFGGGDYTDPLTGRRTLRQLPNWWFQQADTTTRWLMLRARPGEQGFVPLLAAGYTSALRPGLRFASIQVDSVLVDNVMVPDTSWDTTYVAATWQTSLVRDSASRLTLSSGWASQVVTQLPPFPPDSAGETYDPLVSTLAEAWLRVPLAGAGFNLSGAKVNLYQVARYDPAGPSLSAAPLIASDVLSDSSTTLEFNITPQLRRIWVEEDTLSNADSIAVALKLDDYTLLQLRQIGLADPALDPPRLIYHLSQAPAGWRRP